MEKIGYFKGVAISKMDREQLIDYVMWASKTIEDLYKIKDSCQDFLLHKENTEWALKK